MLPSVWLRRQAHLAALPAAGPPAPSGTVFDRVVPRVYSEAPVRGDVAVRRVSAARDEMTITYDGVVQRRENTNPAELVLHYKTSAIEPTSWGTDQGRGPLDAGDCLVPPQKQAVRHRDVVHDGRRQHL